MVICLCYFQVAKIIIPKRSQTIGILLSSLRLEMSEIEDGKAFVSNLSLHPLQDGVLGVYCFQLVRNSVLPSFCQHLRILLNNL